MHYCLIIDEMHGSLLPLLAEHGIQADYRPNIAPTEVQGIIGQYEGLILRSKMKITSDLLDKAVKLRYIARAGAGVDQIDEDYLRRRKLKLINAPEGNRDAVGEHTVGMLLCLLNKIHIGNQEVRQRLWKREENRGFELMGKTVGLIGYGNMGKATAQRLVGFGCRVIAYDIKPYVQSDPFAEVVPIETIWQETDILSLHVPLTRHTHYLIDTAFLEKFHKNIYLVNLARGGVLPMKTVREGLESGKILGAALDVLENEELHTLNAEQEADFEALCASDRVIFTPHVGGWSYESYERINRVLVGKIAMLMQGKP